MEGQTVGDLISGRKKPEKDVYKIIQNIQKSNIQSIKNRTKDLILYRKKRNSEMNRKNFRLILQEQLKPGDAVPRVFSTQKPISSGERFLNQKDKKILLTSNRAFSKEPNILTGAYQNKLKPHTSDEIREIVRRKFMDYDRIVTEQTGPLRILMKKRSSNYVVKKQIYSSKKSQPLFSTFQSSKFDYFEEPQCKMKLMRRSRMKTDGDILGKVNEKRLLFPRDKRIKTEKQEIGFCI